AKHDFGFQDMHSTMRAFRDYASRTLARDEIMNNIIAAQACRHVIVHAGGNVSERAVRQVSGAHPRTFRPVLTEGEKLTISRTEIDALKLDMLEFMRRLSDGNSKV